MRIFHRTLNKVLYTLCETSNSLSNLLNILKSSKSLVSDQAMWSYLLTINGRSSQSYDRYEELLEVFLANEVKKSPEGYSYAPIGKLPTEYHKMIIDSVTNIIKDDATVAKYRPYLIIQIAKGNIRIPYLFEDIDKYAATLKDFAIFSNKGNWPHSKNIYEYNRIQDISEIVVPMRRKATYEEQNVKDSVIIFKKSYTKSNKNDIEVAKLLGLPTPDLNKEVRTYWLRRIFTRDGAIKYGKGTEWCTASSHNLADAEDGTSLRHASDTYLVYGIFQIEREVTFIKQDSSTNQESRTTISSRSPVLQFTPGDQMKNINDETTRPAGQMLQFLKDCYDIVANNPPTQKEVKYLIRPGQELTVDEESVHSYLLEVLEDGRI